ncbi:hypothetical protein [Chamaesiphon sp. OTE_75_metabat_556]|uniref:hypothetical protein n=1 Tax=Chamaesiphon sp. OTE_75_metabat_556 TaxID=2964692 RepID=UPI00286CCE59|nr:hypothetical protein [Chamaesiphon sp. OTE_75_metabat_556]
MPQWKWTIYESNELDKLLYEYLKSCKRMKDNIIQALEAFYFPYALKHMGASPLEVRKAYQRSIDTLQSRIRIMSLDADLPIDENTIHSVDKDRSKLHYRLPRTTSNNAHAHVDRIDVHDDDFAIAPKKLDMDIDNLNQQLDDTGEK